MTDDEALLPEGATQASGAEEAFAEPKFSKGPGVSAPPHGARAKAVPAVTMPIRAGKVTRRTDLADARSLNEPGQPGRGGVTPRALAAGLDAIIDYLDVEAPRHKRYQPRDGLTFCNIYAHDYCHLAGAYLPRVWWSQRAVVDLAQGKTVKPVIADTLWEMRSNDLFRWLRVFGSSFGWRETATLTRLQRAANRGQVALIVARRTEEARSGHLVMVVPETKRQCALRERRKVVIPLQSQAGDVNFKRGTEVLDWWNDGRFAESAFWVHD
jgi:hypothetical protein